MSSHAKSNRSQSNERGSTFVEALVALILFTSACAAAAEGARTALAAFRTVRGLADTDRQLIRADALLRRSISRVSVPAYAARLPVQESADGLRIGYLDGGRHRFLELSFRDHELVVGDRFAVDRVGPFASVSFALCHCGTSEWSTAAVPIICTRIEGAGGEIVTVRTQTATWPFDVRPLGTSGER